MFGQIGDALDSAHRAGLVHRDVKPGNILISTGEHQRHAQGDHVYLTDFGLTKRTSELTGGLTGTGHFLGTVDYVAPEQIQGKPVGPATDIYAFGCVLYECLSGQLPFRRDDDAALLWAHLVEIPPPISGIRPEIPSAANAVVARAMAKDPEARYETCEELLRELEAAFAAPEEVAAATGPGRQRTRPVTRPRTGPRTGPRRCPCPAGARARAARGATASPSTSGRASSPPPWPTTAAWRCSPWGTAPWWLRPRSTSGATAGS